MPRHILAIDQGTTNTKALLFDERGRTVACAVRPVAVRFPEPGWVEQDAGDLWRSAVEAASDCLAQAGGPPLAAIGISNQRESVVVWDRATGRPVGPCITWQCRRTAPFCEELRRRGLAGAIAERTGLGIDPLFSAAKARWLLERTPDGLARAAAGELAIGTVDSWLLWNLSGGAVHASDFTNASRTQLLNLRQLAWDSGMIGCFGIPPAALPELRPSSYIYGTTVAAGAILAGVPIAALIGDSHAALFGHAIFRPGQVKATYGTGTSVMTVTAQPLAAEGLSSTVAWSTGEETRYALEGNISTTGAAVQWTGELLGLDPPAEAAARLADTVEDSGGVYLAPAFVGLGAPHWDDAARGTITGLTRGTTAAHLARAALESIAYQVRDVVEAMERAGCAIPSLLADGGGSRNPRLMQLQADLLDIPVVRSVAADVSAQGAAWLAGLAVGVWESLEELAALPRAVERFQPCMDPGRRARLYAGWRDAVARARYSAPAAAAPGVVADGPTVAAPAEGAAVTPPGRVEAPATRDAAALVARAAVTPAEGVAVIPAPARVTPAEGSAIAPAGDVVAPATVAATDGEVTAPSTATPAEGVAVIPAPARVTPAEGSAIAPAGDVATPAAVAATSAEVTAPGAAAPAPGAAVERW